jgi:pyridoxamine 5'-phosphate oxidase
MSSIGDLRREYSKQILNETSVDSNPFSQFRVWWNEAINSEIIEPNAMTLATSSGDGIPAARIVLLKGLDDKGFVFFTNYNSFKGQQLAENPRACLVFFWKELERQVRITGLVEKTTGKESDDYFSTRPEGSKIGAWASPQSKVIPGRDWLEQEENNFRKQFNSKPVERPAHWGGFRVRPINIEFWQGRQNRLHDRIQYDLKDDGSWEISRLAP